MTGAHFSAHKFPYPGQMGLRGHARFDRGAAGRQFVDDGDIEITVESERERARNGCGGQHQDVRRVPVNQGFIHETFALQHAKAVLFVDGDEAEAGEFDFVFDESVSADDQFGFTGANAFEDGGFVAKLEAADQQFNAIPGGSKNSFGGEVKLHSENFGGSHEGCLQAIFNGDYRGLQGDDWFAAAHVALQ